MKQIYKAIAVSLLLMPLSMAVQAAEHDMSGMGGMHGGDMKGMDHQGMGGMHGGDMMGMDHEGMGGMHGMMGGMHGDMMSPEHLKEKQAHILLMHDLSNKILAEKDPKKQQQLKDQQLEVMKSHMKEMMAKKHHNMDAPPPRPHNMDAPPPPHADKK